MWLINTHNGIKEKDVKPINIDDYPAIKAHLHKYWDELSKRADKGDTPYNLRNCAYMEDFSKQKIIWKIIGNQMAFAIDSNNFIVNNACYILTGESLEYLLMVLNSKIIKWFSFQTNMNKTGVGDVQVGGQNIILFPIPKLTKTEQEPLGKLLVNLLDEKQIEGNKPTVEDEINRTIYRLYGLEKEEIIFIESQ